MKRKSPATLHYKAQCLRARARRLRDDPRFQEIADEIDMASQVLLYEIESEEAAARDRYKPGTSGFARVVATLLAAVLASMLAIYWIATAMYL